MTDNDLLPQIIAPIVGLAVAFCVFLVLVGLWHAMTGRRRA
jgi:lipopolysaccharide export LptBFGC system permease protein LptF